MKKKIAILLAGLLGLTAVAYGVDDVSVRFGIPARAMFSTYTITRFYFINENYNKFSYEPLPSVDEKCVNALFPHFDARPCWYVRRHTKQTIAVN